MSVPSSPDLHPHAIDGLPHLTIFSESPDLMEGIPIDSIGFGNGLLTVHPDASRSRLSPRDFTYGLLGAVGVSNTQFSDIFNVKPHIPTDGLQRVYNSDAFKQSAVLTMTVPRARLARYFLKTGMLHIEQLSTDVIPLFTNYTGSLMPLGDLYRRMVWLASFGLDSKEIAKKTERSKSTVASVLSVVAQSIGSQNREGVIMAAFTSGVITLKSANPDSGALPSTAPDTA